MDASKRKFFSCLSAVCAVPVAGIVAAAGLRPPLEMPITFKRGDVVSHVDVNRNFEILHRAIQERT